MYVSYFNLRERPFDLTLNPHYLFLTSHHREALAAVQYAIAARRGMTVLIGEAGTGKSTIIHAALQSCGAGAGVVQLNNPTLTRAEFIEYLAHAFCLPPEAHRSKAAFLVALTRALTERHDRGEISALIVDEAQTLSYELLEEVRLLANIETGRAKLLPVVLAGQSTLADRLSEPNLAQLKQRIAVRVLLMPFTAAETSAYIHGRIGIAGGRCAGLFTSEAIQEIHRRSQGIARTINVICDNALITSFAAGAANVDHEQVVDVCRDFDLPAPTPSIDTETNTNRESAGQTTPDPEFYWALPDVKEALGDRLAAFCADGRRLELLQIRPDLASIPAFRSAVSEALGVLTTGTGTGFSPPVRLEMSPREGSVALVSEIPYGIRVSDILQMEDVRTKLDFRTRVGLAYELLAALHAFTGSYPSLNHGAISAERLVLTNSGRVRLLDAGLGLALRTINKTCDAFLDDLGIVLPRKSLGGTVPFGPTTDIFQAALVVMELLLGRRLRRDELPPSLGLVESAVAQQIDIDAVTTSSLLRWMRRALWIEDASRFHSTDDALQSFVADAGPLLKEHRVALGDFARWLGFEPAAPDNWVGDPQSIEHPPAEADIQAESAVTQAHESPVVGTEPEVSHATDLPPAPVGLPSALAPNRVPWVAMACVAVLLAIASGVMANRLVPRAEPPVLAGLWIFSNPSEAEVFIDGAPRGRTPMTLKVTPGTHIVQLRQGSVVREMAFSAAAGSDVIQSVEIPGPLVETTRSERDGLLRKQQAGQ